jgi:hypothetical protein
LSLFGCRRVGILKVTADLYVQFGLRPTRRLEIVFFPARNWTVTKPPLQPSAGPTVAGSVTLPDVVKRNGNLAALDGVVRAESERTLNRGTMIWFSADAV